ncbi:putative leucine-rich repeat receptor-like serine/threonine-protein kinase [Senna tora]|uniref:Putative leucine-rich repeat receptor-like serine/threonine-protein kinase n=1 Tax=Senna tora TaxID=362788 RepID=A0A834X408_9FABA|nr:putative leucine-rich repeat receptor-like serine/threonine-protein kinase [Senna tora]
MPNPFVQPCPSSSSYPSSSSSLSPRHPQRFLLDCGATSSSNVGARVWLPDSEFISSGTPKNVFRGARYMVRTTYFYGGVNGPQHPSPPAFDQIVEGTFWSVYRVQYLYGFRPVYIGFRVCDFGRFLYNTTDFSKFGLSLVARHSFGYSGPAIGYPDDIFDRFWEPFGENSPPKQTAAIITSKFQILRALYFAENNESSLGDARILSIIVNGITYYQDLKVTSAGVVVFASQWPLSGPVTITLTPAASSSLGPLINAGEIFDVLPLGGRTLTRDVIALERIKNSLQNPPLDWNGDPCMPRRYSWTGITCSKGSRIRVVTINLTSMDLSGSLSPSIANMTALTNIWLGNNSLVGHIPDLSSLKLLKTLHLEDNQFSGEIPSSLGNISNLYEVFLQNNNLTGQVPTNLIGKPGLDLRTSGNSFLSPAAP